MPNDSESMPNWRRLEILLRRATAEIDPERRKVLLDLVEDIWAPLVIQGLISDQKELFYALAGETLVAMTLYIDELQAQVGLEILEKELGGRS